MPAHRDRSCPKRDASNGDASKSGAPDNRRDALVLAAAGLFREKGFDGTTIRDIAGAVGMRSGSPFYHFASKHELLLAVMEESLRVGLERTRAVVDAPCLALVERFRRLVRAHFGILHEAGSDFIAVMLHDWRSLPPPHRRRIVELKDRYDAIWQETIDALHREGRLRADAKLARLLILGAINVSATWYRSTPRAKNTFDLDALADQTAALFLHETTP
ncbi:MAG: TetR/AcrR family transcriptional regulator [Caldimonas sp.]